VHYHKVWNALRDRNVGNWLTELQKTFDDCTALGIPDTNSPCALRNFIHATEAIKPEFAIFWKGEFCQNSVGQTNLHTMATCLKNWHCDNGSC
jgi:hypothetical protein